MKKNKDYYRNVYLHSIEWKNKRNAIMNFYEDICQDCGCTASEVHHLTYDNIYEEKPEDLIPLCKNCHEVRHGISEKHEYKNDEVITCHQCSHAFKSDTDFFDGNDHYCPRCDNSWGEYGFH